MSASKGSRPFAAGTLGGVLCAAMLNVAAMTGAEASGYLARTGPVPLRFGEPELARPLVLPPLVREAPVPTSASSPVHTQTIATANPAVSPAGAPNPPVIEPSTTATTGFATPVAPDAGAVLLEQLYGAAPPTGLPAIPAPIEPAAPPAELPAETASDMLVVTPQMLASYFKPVRGVTNAPGVAVFVPVGFTPPSAPAGSQATYRIQ